MLNFTCLKVNPGVNELKHWEVICDEIRVCKLCECVNECVYESVMIESGLFPNHIYIALAFSLRLN